MKQFKKLTLIILTLSLLLSGCGGSGTNDNSENSSANENNTTQEDTNDSMSIEKDEYTFSEYLSTGETLWFLTDGYGKDAKIKNIFVINEDGSLYYVWDKFNLKHNGGGIASTLGEAEQMDDAEIISLVKQVYHDKVTEQVDSLSNLMGHDYDESVLVTDPAPLMAEYKENIKPAQYKLGIISDSTGNKTEREVLSFQDYAPLSIRPPYFRARVWDVKLSYIVPYESDQGGTNSFSVYDSWYSGYRVESITDTSLKDAYFLLTRMNSNKIFKLDEVGTENIGIDNIDSLFNDISIKLEWEAARS